MVPLVKIEGDQHLSHWRGETKWVKISISIHCLTRPLLCGRVQAIYMHMQLIVVGALLAMDTNPQQATKTEIHSESS